MRDIAEGDGVVPARKPLSDQTRREEITSRASLERIDGDPQESHLSEGRHDVIGPPLAVIHALLQRPKLLACKIAGEIENLLLCRREREREGGHGVVARIHCYSQITGCRSATHCSAEGR